MSASVAKPVPNVNVEVTDTFGGEANYSWVRRYSFSTDESTDSDYHVIRKAKALAGFTGVRCRKESFGDTISLYPQGTCIVIFISGSW